MPQAILEKRTYDNRAYNVICTNLLAPNTTIASINSVTADQGALQFTSPALNPTALIFPDGTQAPANTVIQFNVAGGVIPSGLTFLMCTIRARFTDSLGENIEATVLLNLTDTAST